MWENRPTTEKCGLLQTSTLTIGIAGSAFSIGRTWTDGSTSNGSGGGVPGRENRLKIGRQGPCDTGKALPYTSQESQDPSARMPSGHWVVKVLMRLARTDNRTSIASLIVCEYHMHRLICRMWKQTVLKILGMIIVPIFAGTGWRIS